MAPSTSDSPTVASCIWPETTAATLVALATYCRSTSNPCFSNKPFSFAIHKGMIVAEMLLYATVMCVNATGFGLGSGVERRGTVFR